MMQEQNAAIAFYPLATTMFNKSKSNIFWIEMTYAGSAVFGNKDLPEYDKVPCHEWHENIIKVAESELKMANDYSWRHILDNYLLSKVNSKRIERLLA